MLTVCCIYSITINCHAHCLTFEFKSKLTRELVEFECNVGSQTQDLQITVNIFIMVEMDVWQIFFFQSL